MNKYYFTFGGDGQIYRGGWVEIHADSIADAQEKFAKHFGDRAYKGQFLSYAFHYTESQFAETIMSKTGNGGAGCHEIIN